MDKKLKIFLNSKVDLYNQPSFIAADPISIPHRFSKKEDIEISAFFAALFAWGNRTTIINKSSELMQLMDEAPHQFITQHKEYHLKCLLQFRHRTFTTTDLLYIIHFLKQHYSRHHSLEAAFQHRAGEGCVMEQALNGFYHYFFSLEEAPVRTRKHIAAPFKGSTCKRLNMFLRWMVRDDKQGVDFGLWKTILPAQLICPVDVHVGRVAQRLGLVQRQQIDWQTAIELTENLRAFDPDDPVKYDFALFSLGVAEGY